MRHPDDPRLATAAQHLAERRYREAHAQCMAVIEADPKAAQAYALLGCAAIDTGAFDKGGDLFQRAWALDPENAAYGAAFARCLAGLNRDVPALAAAEMALVFGPGDAETFDTLGVVFSRAGQNDNAALCFRGAIRLEPNTAGHHLNLGWAEQRRGDKAAAAAAFRNCVTLDPGNERAVLALVQLLPQTLEGNFTGQLFDAYKAAMGDADRMLRIGMALAKTFEDQDQAVLALDWLLLGKGAKAVQISDLEIRQADLFKAAAATASGEAPARPGDDSDLPIFIFGLPGDQLEGLDRLLATHPGVTSAGETMALPLTARRHAGSPTRELIDGPTLRAAGLARMAQLGADYVFDLRALAARGDRVLDRQPANILYAGLISAALPNARMIHVRRHPVEACLAALRLPFAAEVRHLDWAYGLESTARYYLAVDRLAAHWRATLSADRYIEVSWDAVTADPDGQRAALLAWLGLSPAAGDQPPATAYAPARGWARYGAKLQPLLDALIAGGALTAEEAARS